MRKLTRLAALLLALAGMAALVWFSPANSHLAELAPWRRANAAAPESITNGVSSAISNAISSATAIANPGTNGVDAQKLALLKQAKPSRAFVLLPQQSLQFTLSSDKLPLRLVSNASIRDLEAARRAHLQDPGKRWQYGLKLELLDAQGQLLEQRQLQLAANLLEIKRPDGLISGPAFYLANGLTPLAGETNALNLQGIAGSVKSLRVSLTGFDPAISDVALRLYQSNSDANDKPHQWQRLSTQQQEELARTSVHDKALLQAHEKQNLIRNSAQALGPNGMEGRDYQVRDLYLLFENEGKVQAAPIANQGVLFDQNLFATFPIPPQGGKIRLEISASPRGAASDGVQQPIQLRWFGNGLFQRQHSDSGQLIWQGQSLQHTLKLAGGLLELQGPRELLARVWLESESGPTTEITPLPQFERVFVATPEQAIDFAVAASNSQSGLRLSVRSLSRGSLRPTRAHYTAFDANGKQLGQGVLAVDAKAAHYERLMADYSGNNPDPAQNQQLSELVQGFFVLPANTARFSVRADSVDAPLLVAAHTRPWTLAREQRIPEDSYAWDALGKRIPAWFLLKPEQQDQLLSNDRSRLLQLQSRPLELNEQQGKILTGQYQWQDFRPRGNWLARPIYTPRDVDVPYREDVLPTMFTPLALAQANKLEFPRYQGSTVLTPTLVWLAGKQSCKPACKQATRLDISVDGQPFFSIEAHGPYGEYELPGISAGTHQIRVSSSDNTNHSGQVLINHVRPSANALLRRIGQRFNGEMVFDYERNSAQDETLSVRVYQAAGQQQAGKFTVKIEGPALPTLTPLSGWVFLDRIASVSPAPGTGRVFDTEGQQSDAGNPIYLPLPKDAPLGRYRITLRAAGNGSYVSLARLSGEMNAQRKIHHQPELSHVQNTE